MPKWLAVMPHYVVSFQLIDSTVLLELRLCLQRRHILKLMFVDCRVNLHTVHCLLSFFVFLCMCFTVHKPTAYIRFVWRDSDVTAKVSNELLYY